MNFEDYAQHLLAHLDAMEQESAPEPTGPSSSAASELGWKSAIGEMRRVINAMQRFTLPEEQDACRHAS
jgi:hypothetical protein